MNRNTLKQNNSNTHPIVIKLSWSDCLQFIRAWCNTILNCSFIGNILNDERPKTFHYRKVPPFIHGYRMERTTYLWWGFIPSPSPGRFFSFPLNAELSTTNTRSALKNSKYLSFSLLTHETSGPSGSSFCWISLFVRFKGDNARNTSNKRDKDERNLIRIRIFSWF